MGENTNNRKITNTFNSVVLVLVLTLGTKLLGFVRDSLIGSQFATGLEAEAYIITQRLTVFIFMAMGAAITASVVPIITRYYVNGEDKKANEFINKILTVFLIVACIMSAIGVLFTENIARAILDAGNMQRLNLTIEYTKILFPSMIFIFLAYAIRAVLQSREHMVGYSLMSVPFNIFIIAYMVTFVNEFGMTGLIISILIAWALQFVAQFPFTAKDGIKYGLNFKGLFDKEMREFFALFFPATITSLIYTASTIIDLSFASRLKEGYVATLGYGTFIYGAISQTLVYSISAVLFPKLVENFTKKDLNEFRVDAKNTISNIIYIIIPVMAGCILLSRQVVEVTFMRNNFTPFAADATTTAVVFLSFGFLGFALQEIITKTFFAAKNTIIPTVISVMSVALNFSLNTLLIDSMGMAGLALATSIAITFNAILSYLIFQIKYGKWDNIDILRILVKTMVSASIMYYSVNYILAILKEVIAINNNLVYNLLSSIVAAVLGAIIYALMTYILRVKQTEEIVKKILSKTNAK